MQNYPYAPVLLITFNRPDYTAKVVERLREIKIPKLYVFNDGPRDGNDKDVKARAEIKEIIEVIDWDCELNLYYSPRNLGCGIGVSSAISWAFTNEDRLVILEDDCVPSPAFFPYCNELLEKYKDDNRIWLISGENHQYPDWAFKLSDYIFSQFGYNCGWATWKRCWDHFDINMSRLPDFLESNLLDSVFSDKRIVKTYKIKYKRLFFDKVKPSFWTIQFGFQMISNRGYVIIPRANLIENIGVLGDHTTVANKYINVKSVEEFQIYKHPLFILPNTSVELYQYNARIKPMIEGKATYIRVIRRLLRTFTRCFPSQAKTRIK
ncbi:MAG: glycosyltransferase [Candidatus Cloacimonas sp.]|jgi:hypothetical protein|nr:glycosyltransferase [Candidatus Cloacimonas sp.]